MASPLNRNLVPPGRRQNNQTIMCPFCDYKPPSGIPAQTAEYDLAHHVEIAHREEGTGQSPFEVTQHHPATEAEAKTGVNTSKRRLHSSSPSLRSHAGPEASDSEGEYIECPRNCGETISKQMLDQHVDLHRAEDLALDELEGQYKSAGAQPGEMTAKYHADDEAAYKSRQKRPKSRTRDILKDFLGVSVVSTAMDKAQRKSDKLTTGQRLGRKELGPHAYEEKMPSWLHRQLRDGPPVTWINQIGPDGRTRRVERVANETPGLIPALADLCRQDRAVSKAWLCSPGAKHIFKLKREGGFCGYRNIQMQVSWMQHRRHPGYEHFGIGTGTPNILDLQVMIEDAWRHGFNSTGKTETGGIIGTRKYIGTPEAQALFQDLGIPCNARAFTKTSRGDRADPVYAILLEYVLEYFSKGVIDPTEKVYMTDLPPIYFQHPGHSLTIVGIEVHKNRDINLLVFDPMFATVPAMIRYLSTTSPTANPGKILRAFRRGEDYVKKYKSFEVLSLVQPGVTRSRGNAS